MSRQLQIPLRVFPSFSLAATVPAAVLPSSHCPLVCWLTGSLFHWFIVLLACCFTGLLARWLAGPPAVSQSRDW